MLEQQRPMDRDRGGLFCLLSCIAVFGLYLGFVLFSSPQLSPSFDEPNHIRSGMGMLTQGRFIDTERAWWTKIQPLHPPSDILPALFARWDGRSADFRQDRYIPFSQLLTARIASHLIGALILGLVFVWARELWGIQGACLSILVLVLNPLFISHSTIVSSDLAMAFGGILLAYLFWRWFLRDTRPRISGIGLLMPCLGLGLVLGFSVFCKLGNLVFFAVVPLGLVWWVWQRRKLERVSALRMAGCWLLIVFLIEAVGLIIAVVVYDFAQQGVEKTVFESWFLPFGIGEKLANGVVRAKGLVNFPPAFFAGGLKAASAFHYLVFYLARTPPGLLMVQFVAVGGGLLYASQHRTWRAVTFLILLCAGLSVSFATRGFYLGLRHLLLPVVLFSVLGGGLVGLKGLGNPLLRRLLACLVLAAFLWSGIEMFRAAPYQLSYINFAGKGRLAFMADADWGQGLLALSRWQMEHSPDKEIWLAYFGNARPEDFGIRYRGLLAPLSQQARDPEYSRGRAPGEVKGFVAISATHLAGRFMRFAGEPDDYYRRWLSREPHTVLANSILIYDQRVPE
jgi:hypothetical protein